MTHKKKSIAFCRVHPSVVRRLGRVLREHPCCVVRVVSTEKVLYKYRDSPDSSLVYGLIYVKSSHTASDTGTRTEKKSRPDLATERELDYYRSQFRTDPSRRLVRKSLALAKKTGVWDSLSVLGFYLEHYEKRYYREWRGSLVGLVDLFRGVEILVKRVGTEEAREAIEAVFSPKMSWASNQMGLLLSKDGYARFIVPAMDLVRHNKRERGEQAEWTGDRSKESKAEEVEL